jgi:hypothetical protein
MTASRYESVRGAADVRYKPAGPGHAVSARCDGCLKWLSTIEGCSRYRGVLLHCQECTEARKHPKHDAHVKLFRKLVLPLRENTSAMRHDHHVKYRNRLIAYLSTRPFDEHVKAHGEWLKSLRCNRGRELMGGHVQARKAWVQSVVKTYSKVVDGHVLWTGVISRGAPILRVDGHVYHVRRLYFGVTEREPDNKDLLAPSCGQDRCLSCLVSSPARQRSSAILTLDDLKARCEVDQDCGCWRWLGYADDDGVPRVSYTDPVDKRRKSDRGRRAALNLARGRALPGKYLVWAKVKCDVSECLNPEHSMSGNAVQRGSYMRRHGLTEVFRKNTTHLKQYAESRRIISPEMAVSLVQRMDAGETAEDIARELNVAISTVRGIRRGERSCDVAVRIAPNASIFTLAQSLKEAS